MIGDWLESQDCNTLVYQYHAYIFYYTGKKTWAQETLWREIYCSTSIVETVPLLFVLINLLLYIINKTKSKTQVCLINSVKLRLRARTFVPLSLARYAPYSDHSQLLDYSLILIRLFLTCHSIGYKIKALIFFHKLSMLTVRLWTCLLLFY